MGFLTSESRCSSILPHNSVFEVTTTSPRVHCVLLSSPLPPPVRLLLLILHFHMSYRKLHLNQFLISSISFILSTLAFAQKYGFFLPIATLSVCSSINITIYIYI